MAPDADQAGFVAAVAAAFAAAASRAGLREHHFRLGGLAVLLRLAGPALEPALTPALAHLAAPPAPADLTLHLWDTASTGVPMPPPPVPLGGPLPRGEVPTTDAVGYQLAVGLDAASVSVLGHAADEGFYWIRAADDVTIHERGAPLRSLLHWRLRRHGQHLVHGAAVGVPGGGVLLAGRGGSGKSTTALACLEAGLLYAGDDYCLLDEAGPPYIHSLYCSAKVHPHQLDHFPRLRAAVANPAAAADEKALLYLQPLLPAQLTPGFLLRAVLLPRVTGQPVTRLAPATPFEALRALAPSSIMQLPGAGPAEFEALGRLVRRVPCYWLELGTDLAALPSVIRALLTA